METATSIFRPGKAVGDRKEKGNERELVVGVWEDGVDETVGKAKREIVFSTSIDDENRVKLAEKLRGGGEGEGERKDVGKEEEANGKPGVHVTSGESTSESDPKDPVSIAAERERRGLKRGEERESAGVSWSNTSASSSTTLLPCNSSQTTSSSVPSDLSDGGGRQNQVVRVRAGSEQETGSEEESKGERGKENWWGNDCIEGFSNGASDLRPLWAKIPEKSLSRFTSMPFAVGDELEQFEQKMQEGEYLVCVQNLESFRASIAQKYGFNCDGHRAACTQLVVFCLVYAQVSTELPGSTSGVTSAKTTPKRNDTNGAYLLIENAWQYTQEASHFPLWDKKRLRAWTADSMARYYVLRGKYSGALAWCNVALKAETDLTCLAVWSLHAAFVLSHLNRHQDALLTLKGAFKVLDWVRADTLKSLSDEERREIASEFDRSSNVSLDEPRQEIIKEAETSTMSWRIEEASKERKTSESLGNRTAKKSRKIERDVMQNVWLLEIITQLNTSIEYLHVFRCGESLRLARRAADVIEGVLPVSHNLAIRVRQVLASVQGLAAVNTIVRSDVGGSRSGGGGGAGATLSIVRNASKQKKV